MNNRLYIRIAELQDLKSILEIERQSFAHEAFNARQFKYLLTAATSCFFVVTMDNLIAGYAILLWRKNSKLMRIYSIAVAKEFRGKGVAHNMLQEAKRFAKVKKRAALSLEVSADNARAIFIYHNEGFITTGQKQHYYGQNKHALVMKHHLEQ